MESRGLWEVSTDSPDLGVLNVLDIAVVTVLQLWSRLCDTGLLQNKQFIKLRLIIYRFLNGLLQTNLVFIRVITLHVHCTHIDKRKIEMC